jgi:hypothetical protein
MSHLSGKRVYQACGLDSSRDILNLRNWPSILPPRMLRSPCLKGLLAVALALVSPSRFAGQVNNQTGPCPPAIPVTVILPDGRAVIHLTATAFDARVHGHPTDIAGFDEDLTPKRIVLVLDASKNVNAEAWKIEMSVARFLVDGSPPQVTFALIILNADAPPLDFTASRETVKSKLGDLVTSRPTNAKLSEDIYGGLMSALKLLGTRQFGDTIFAFFGGADDSHRTDVGAVQRAFVEQGVRLFGLVLGQESLYGVYMTTPGSPAPREVPFDPDTNELGRLAVETGGLLAVENTRMPWTTYHLTDERLKQIQVTAHRFYSQMVTPYRIQIATDAPTKPESWSIDLTEAIKLKAPGARVLFPHQLASCAPGNTR